MLRLRVAVVYRQRMKNLEIRVHNGNVAMLGHSRSPLKTKGCELGSAGTLEPGDPNANFYVTHLQYWLC